MSCLVFMKDEDRGVLPPGTKFEDFECDDELGCGCLQEINSDSLLLLLLASNIPHFIPTAAWVGLSNYHSNQPPSLRRNAMIKSKEEKSRCRNR